MDAHRDVGTARGRGATLGHQPGIRARTMVERPDSGCQHGHAPGCLGPGNRRAQTYPGMHAGQALTEPRPSPTDPDLDLHGRLEAVDVWTIRESDLDESHGGEDSGMGRARRLDTLRPRPVSAKCYGEQVVRIAVVGAGPAGLTAAHRLLAAGHAPTVLEAGSYAGRPDPHDPPRARPLDR